MLVRANTWVNLENMVLSERRHSQKPHILSDSFYTKCPELVNYRDKKQIGDCQGLDGIEVWTVTTS